jgi:hypothetical protein
MEANMPETSEFDFDEYCKLGNEERERLWPLTKSRFNGESLWTRKLGPTLRMLDNNPLEDGYHWADIVKVDGRENIVELVKHTFPRRYGFRYDSGVGDKAAKLLARTGVAECWKAFGDDVHGYFFFWDGLGFILTRGAVGDEEVVAAMRVCADIIEVVSLPGGDEDPLPLYLREA